MSQKINKPTIKRYECELCNCSQFCYNSPGSKFKCKCGHGDVWHSRDGHIIKRNRLKQLFKPLIKLFNKPEQDSLNKECPICYNNIKNLVVFNCGHGLCAKCSERILTNCPICRSEIYNKIVVYI